MRKTSSNSGALWGTVGTVASRRGVRGAWVCVSAAGLIGGCGGGDGAKSASPDRLDWSQAAALARAQTCDDALETFRAAARTQMELDLANSRRCALDVPGCITNAGDAGLPVTLSPDNGEAAGVDALDSVKTDGTHIYTIVGGELVVLASWPASATAIVASVALPAGDQRGLFLAGTKVVALTAVASAAAVAAREATGSPWGWEMPQPDVTIASVIDVSNPATPVVTARKGFGGDLVASRRVEDRAFLALSSRVAVPGLRLWPTDLPMDRTPDEVEAAFEALHAGNEAAIDAVTIDTWLPHSVAIGADGALGERGAPISRCSDVFATKLHAGSGLMTIATVDVASGATTGAATIAGEWRYVVASRDALYVAGMPWDRWLFAEQADEARATQIHKFALTDSSRASRANPAARYVASGKVLGWMNDEYAMDEYGGNLRVVTTTELVAASDLVISESRVTVLAEEDGALVERGVVAGVGQGESAARVRFVGDRGFAAASVGLLEVLDVSDPSAPTIAGTVDLGGEASYLQSLDAEHVLAFGRVVDDEGNARLQLAIIDVRDPYAPTVTTRATVDQDWTTFADVRDPRAVRWVPERNLFIVPVSSHEYEPGFEGYRSALFVYHVSPSAVTPLGSVSHADLLADLVGGEACTPRAAGDVAHIARSVVIDDFVYSLSPLGAAVHDTRALEAGALAELQLVDDAVAASWAEAIRCASEASTGDQSDAAR